MSAHTRISDVSDGSRRLAADQARQAPEPKNSCLAGTRPSRPRITDRRSGRRTTCLRVGEKKKTRSTKNARHGTMLPPQAAYNHHSGGGLSLSRLSLGDEATARKEIVELRRETQYATKRTQHADSQLAVIKSEVRERGRRGGEVLFFFLFIFPPPSNSTRNGFPPRPASAPSLAIPSRPRSIRLPHVFHPSDAFASFVPHD